MGSSQPLLYDTWFQDHYREVHDNYNNDSNYEHWTTGFWEYVFKRYFEELCFAHQGQKPSAPELKPCGRGDAKLTYIEAGTRRVMTLLFFEAKKMGTAPYLMRDVEDQALQACALYLQNNANIKFIYAVTAIGTQARIWKYDRDTNKLESLEGKAPTGVRSAYIDAASPNSSRLRTALLEIKEDPPSTIQT